MNFEIARQRLVNVRVVDINRIEVGLHLEKIKWNHLAAEALRGLVLEEPLLVVLLSVEQLVHLVLLTLNLIRDLLCILQHDFFSRLRAHIDGKQLLGGGLDAEQMGLLQSLPLAVEG